MEKLLKFFNDQVYLNNKFDFVFDFYYKVSAFFKNCKRLIDYAPIVWNHRNWDYGFIIRFNKKLHEDLYKGLFVDGYACSNKTKRRRLKIVLELLDRLDKDNYESWVDTYLSKKYGEYTFKTKKVENSESKPSGPYYSFVDSRQETLSPEEYTAYRKEFLKLYKMASLQQQADTTFLYQTIAKYSNHWWD